MASAIRLWLSRWVRTWAELHHSCVCAVCLGVQPGRSDAVCDQLFGLKKVRAALILLYGACADWCADVQTVKKKKTNVVKGNLNPAWNEKLDFPVQDVRIQALHLTVFDKDMFGSDFM